MATLQLRRTKFTVELNFANEDLAPRYGEAEVVLEGFEFRTAVQLNESSIGLASQFGIEGPAAVDLPVLEYAAYEPAEGVLVNLPIFGADLSSYTAVWDMRIDQLSGFQSLLQTDPSNSADGELFIRSDGGLGINGNYDGTVIADQWSRIAITVDDQGDGTSLLSKYLDGVFLDSQSVSADRFTLSAADGFLLFSDNDQETSTGYLAHFGLSEQVLDATAIAALGGVDGDGPFEEQGVQLQQLSLSFDSHWRPYDNQLARVLATFDGAEEIEIFRYDSSNTNDIDQRNETVEIEFLAPQGAKDVQLLFSLSDADNDWFWAVDNIELSDAEGTLLLAEDFNSLEASLQSAVDENIEPSILGWTQDAPNGWMVENDPQMPQGTTEWQGWSFATPEFWTSADTQARGEFSKGTGVIAIGDPDEWDDFNGGSGGQADSFDSVLRSPLVSLGSTGDRNLNLSFDSSFRPYADQTGEVLVSLDGGEFTSLLVLDTATVPGGASSLSRIDESVSLEFSVPGSTEDVAFRFEFKDADNDWWWAIDNVSLSEQERTFYSEDFDSLTPVLKLAVDESPSDPNLLGWTDEAPTGWTRENDPSMPQGATEWQGWSFATPEFWIDVAGDQSRSSFSKASGVAAIADGDEWDDFNGGSVAGNDFNSALTTPAISISTSAGPNTYQFGFDDYQATIEFGFQSVEVMDQAPLSAAQDNIKDLLIEQGESAIVIDLAAAFGAGATSFVATVADGTVLDAEIVDSTLSLSGLELGHSDVSVSAQAADGTALEENFRAIVTGPNAYVFAIIPDTQDYTSNPGIADTFGNMTDWLLAQQASLGIAHMIHVGDIVQFGATNQWEIAEEAIERLDGELSYTLAIGNHDQQRPGFASAFSFETDVDSYFTLEQLGATAAQGGGTYDGFDVGDDTFGNGDTYVDSIRNHYTTLTTPDGTNWLVMSLEFGMPDDVLRWASEVIEAHQDHRVIIDTHSWNGGDGRITPTTEPLNTDNGGWGYAIRDNPRGVNDGEDAWREFASKYPNITFTFNGHNFMGGAETVVSYGAGDDPVYQMFVNYQNGAWAGVEGIGTNGGNGAIRLVVIDPDNDRFTTHTKLVELDSYFEEFPDHQEVFENVKLGTPEQIALAKAGDTTIVVGDGLFGSVALDPTATLGSDAHTRFEWYKADGEKLGETDGAPLSVSLQTGTHRLQLKVTDANGNVSTDEQVVIVEAPDALLTETFDDGDAAGWGASATDVGDLFELGTDLNFSLPSIGGVGQIPLSLNFDSSFRPYDNMTGEVMVSYDGGVSFATLLTLDTESTPGGSSSLARVNEEISVEALAPNSASSAQFAFRLSQADNDWWWAIDNVDIMGPPEEVTTEFWRENFDGLASELQPAVDENLPPETLGWTHSTPDGWARSVDAPQGASEWQGWSFATPEFWVEAGAQSRDAFTLGDGVVAIADGDEWDDFNTGSISGDDFNTTITTAPIDLSAQGTNSADVDLKLSFDSSFRPYDAQTGQVLVSFDGGEFSPLLTLDTSSVPGGSSSLSRIDETVLLDLVAPQGAQQVQFRFDYTDADNDWWWAIDNLALAKVETVEPILLSENFNDLPLQGVVDETAPEPDRAVWTPTPPDGWEQEVAATTSQGSTEFQGWTFHDKSFWIDTAGNQARDAFALSDGNIAIADPDEWDDANAGAAGDTDEFDSALKTPAIDLTSLGGGQQAGGEAGVMRVAALAGDDALHLGLTNSTGQVDSYSLIFDLLLTPTSQTFSALYQTDVSNSGDAEIYFRNDGATASIGISGDYDGALNYGEWGRVALVFETNAAGEQTLYKYLDGAFLDDQVVDTDVNDGSRWSIDADAGLLLFSEPNGFTSDLYINALHFTPEVLDATAIGALGGVDVDGPRDAASSTAAFQLNFDQSLDSRDYGNAELIPVSLAGPDATSYLVKGSIFGNPDGTGDAALYQQSNGANEVLLWMGEGSETWSDYVFDVVIEPADNDTVGVVFYYQDEQNFYQLSMDQQSDTRTLSKFENGIETVLATETASYRHFAAQDLRVAIVGSKITITLDDELVFGAPVTDATALLGGTVGVLSGSMDRVIFDNISVNPVALAARALTSDPAQRWVADVDGDGTATVNLSAAATLAAASVSTYHWLVDDALVATGETVELNLAPGQTEVVLRVVDTNGAVSEDQITLDIAAHEAVLLADDFDAGDLDGWAIVDEGTLEGPSDWQVNNGELTQTSNINSSQQGTGSTAFSAGGDGPFILRDGTYALWADPAAQDWTNYAFSATLTPNDDDGIGLLFHYIDADNYYKLEVDAQTGLAMLTRHLDGRETILARGYYEYTPGEAQQWRIEIEDGRIAPYIDGKAVFGTEIEDRELPAGTVGLYAWGSENLAFDNIEVTDLRSLRANDDALMTEQARPVAIDVLANDVIPGSGEAQALISTQPNDGLALAVDDGVAYIPQSGFVGDDTFDYQLLQGDGNSSGATVDVTVVEPASEIDGSTSRGAIRGTADGDVVFAGERLDRIFGKEGDDVLLGSDGTDLIFGGDGQDIIIDGSGRGILFGGADADLFVISTADTLDYVRDFESGTDQVLLTIEALLTADGRVAGSKVQVVDGVGDDLLLQVDLGAGFESVANLTDAAGSSIDDILYNRLDPLS